VAAIAGRKPLSTRDEAPRRRSTWRFLARTTALALVLGVGWIAGIKTQGRVDLDDLASAASMRVADIGGLLESAGRSLLGNLKDQPASDAAVTGPGPALQATSAGPPVGQSGVKPGEARASTDATVEDLRGTIERLASSTDSNRRELLAKLDDFNERLHRLERSGSDAPAPVSARLDQLAERLGRIERSVPAASAPPQPPAAASSVTPPRPVQASAAAPNLQASAKPQAPAEPKKIADWTVREVIDGVAILQGRRGVIEVSVGDVVPGAGRVQSIARQGGRWIVATNTGVITAR
jgi:hypothetical protein